MVLQARVRRLDHRREGELLHTVSLCGLDDGNPHCCFVRRERGANMEDTVHASRCLGKTVRIAEVSNENLGHTQRAGDGCPCVVAHERMDDSVAAHQFGNNPGREFAGGSNNEDLWLVQYHKRVLCKFHDAGAL